MTTADQSITNGTGYSRLPRPSRRLPIIGDLLRLDPVRPLQAEARLAQDLGPIFEIKIMGDPLVVVAGADIAREVFDEKRFAKAVVPPLTKIREIAKDGLFTAYNSEPNWAKAHNVLAPAFSKESMRSYHSTMRHCVDDLIAHWGRSIEENPDARVQVPEDMNKLTLEIIGRTGFGHEFHSFDTVATDPFAAAMSRALSHVSSSANDIPVIRNLFGYGASGQFPKDLATMESIVDNIISARRRGGARIHNRYFAADAGHTRPRYW
ncbi:MAG: cytochrome P450 [Rhodococcus sp. (in: high G+C Gram-positive bacteria)]